MISSAPTEGKVGFKGSLGYNNGVYFLNDISAQLYSNNSLGATARSLNIEDIEKEMTEEGLEYVYSYENVVIYGSTKKYTNNKYYPNLYVKENGSGVDTSEIKKDGIEQSDKFYVNPTVETYSEAGSNGLTVTQKFYNRTMNSTYYKNSTFYNLIHSYNTTYWIASRYVNAANDYVSFGIRFINNNTLYGNGLFYSQNKNDTNICCLRPLVSLNSNIKIVSGDGSKDNPYQINNYL